MPPPEHLPATFILHASLQTRCVAKSFGSCKSGKRAEKSCTCSSQWILNSFLATIMSIISHDACSINVAGKYSGGGISTGGALLLEYFKSIKHAYVNFASGTVDYRPPLIIRNNLNYRLGNFSENLLYSTRIKEHTSLDAHTV